MSKRNFFTETETNLLKELVSKHISVVECKRTDHRSINLKAKAWEDITEEFNSFSMPGLNKRNDKQLKKCWDNMKMREKKKAAEERRERLRTGGGPCNVKIDDSSTQISAMVSTQIQPMKNPYDCDAGPDDNQSEDQNEIEVDDDDVNDEEDNSPKSKRPASTASTCNPCSKRTKSHEGTTRPQSSTSSVQKKVLERQEEEHQARMTLYRTQLEHAIEEHKIKMEILQLEKQRVLASIGDNSSVSLTINTSATQTTPRTSPSIFSISEIIKPSVG